MSGFEVPHEYKANRAPMDSDKQRCLDCGEAQAHAFHAKVNDLVPKEVTVEPAQPQPQPEGEWFGDSPFWLMCQTGQDVGNVAIDVDEPGWIDKNKPLMRQPGTWLLMDKRTGRPLFCVLMEEGDQFYFAKRHVGDLIRGKEVICYGIGKKKADGTPVNLWLLPNGMVCGGEDVDILAARML